MLTSKIKINEFNLLHSDKNRPGEEIACYIRNDLSHNVKSYFPEDIFELQPSSFPKTKFAFTSLVANDVEVYFDFCTMFGLNQLNESPTRITWSSSSIIDQILLSFPDRLTQPEILNVGLFDQQLIHCTKKFNRIKRGGHKQIKFSSFKNFFVHGYEESLIGINFPEYKNVGNVNDASNFIQKLMEVINKVAPTKKKSLLTSLINRNKRFRKHKNSRFYVDKEIYK